MKQVDAVEAEQEDTWCLRSVMSNCDSHNARLQFSPVMGTTLKGTGKGEMQFEAEESKALAVMHEALYEAAARRGRECGERGDVDELLTQGHNRQGDCRVVCGAAGCERSGHVRQSLGAVHSARTDERFGEVMCAL